MTGLLREERLRVTHGSVAAYRKPFLLDPYTLLVYKKGLYLARHTGLTRARVTQIMNLLLLAPDLQGQGLFMKPGLPWPGSRLRTPAPVRRRRARVGRAAASVGRDPAQ